MFKKGDRVYIEKWNYGTVLKVHPDRYEIKIDGENRSRTFMASYVKENPTKTKKVKVEEKKLSPEELSKKHLKFTQIIKEKDYVSKYHLYWYASKLSETEQDYLKNETNKHNLEYTQKEYEAYKKAFYVEKKLDLYQRQAVASDEQSTLVVAGAGCGKTTMLVSKIAYLLQKGVDPSKILVISYTKKTIADLKSRLQKFTTVSPTTFHALGFKILGKREHHCDENLLRKIIKNLSKKNVSSNTIYDKLKLLVLKFIGLADSDYMEQKYEKLATSFTKKEDIEKHESTYNYTTLTSVLSMLEEVKKFEKEKKTLKGQKVKSLAEAKIANFLFLNGVNYEYEKEYPFPYFGTNLSEERSYHPDFFIKQGEKEIWLEHFGVTIDENKDKHAAWCSEEKKYIQQMEEKIFTHKTNSTTLIQTNETLHHDGVLLSYLGKKLKDEGIVLTPLTKEQITFYLQKLRKWKKYESFENFLERFINLFKLQSKYETLDDLEKVITPKDKLQSQKTALFFNIVKKIYQLYQEELKKNHLIDFSDMIKDAIKKLEQIPIQKEYEYIIVDEFQDIDQSKLKLLKLLQEKNNAKLFCVGDDWQSIYGFSGSDVSIFTSFAKIFPYANDEFYLQNTHRNSQELLDISTQFIVKNPGQKKKKLLSEKHSKSPIKVAHYYHGKKKTESIAGCQTAEEAFKIILEDMKKHNLKPSVTILGRYTNDVHIIFNKSTDFIVSEDEANNIFNIKCKKYPNLNIVYMNIHQAKGLDWNNVVLFLQEGEGIPSFPTGYSDNYLIEPLLFNKSDTYLNAEERRIFYVAITRCKDQLYLINSEANSSSFFKEIEKNCISINDTLKDYCKKTNQILCPGCQNGIYSQKTNKAKNTSFWACDNINCKIATKEKAICKCPVCEGVLVPRTSSKTNNSFLGCSNFPRCRFITHVVPKKKIIKSDS